MADKTLKVTITAEVAKFKKGVEEAQGKIKKFAPQTEAEMQKVDQAIKNAGSAFLDFGKKGAVAIAGLATGLGAAAIATDEYRERMALLNSAFEAAGSSADVAYDVYSDLYRVLGETDRSVEAANHLSHLTTNEQELAQWTTICTGVWATYNDSLPIEGLTEAANETAKTGTVTGVLADALNWAGVSEDAFNESLAACNDEAEREKLIRETLLGLYDEAAGKYEENASATIAQREAQEKLQKTLSELGEAIAPVLTAFTDFATEALQPVVDKVKPLAEEYAPMLKEKLEEAGEAVGKAFGFFVDNWGIIAAIGGVITGIAVAIGLYNVMAGLKAAMDAAQVTSLGALVAVQWAHVAATLAVLAPYLLIVAAIAAVIAIIVLCVTHWEQITDAVSKAWESIKEATANAVQAVKEKFEAMKQAISEKIEAAKTAVSNVFNGIKQAISDKIQAAKDTVSNAVDGIKRFLSFDGVKNTISNIFNSIKQTISDKLEAAKNVVKNMIDKIKGFFNFSWSLPSLKVPEITITGSFSLNPPSVPHFGLKWYARGGVFDKPTIFGAGSGFAGIGEAGAEAVVPLEHNTQWLDKIAERLNSNSGRDIVLVIDGKEFARASLDSINALTRQTGKLNLELA